MFLLLALLAAAASVGPGMAEIAPAGTETPALPALIDRTVLFGNPDKGAGTISPNGKMASWKAPSDEGVMNVWVAPVLEGGEIDDGAAQLVTDSKERPLGAYHWTADSSHILYSLDKEGNENDHVYVTNVYTGISRDLTPVIRDDVKVIIGWLSSRHPGTVVILLNDRDASVFDLHKLDIESGDTELLLENDGGYTNFLMDNNNEVRGSIAPKPDGSAIIYKRSENGQFEEFQTIPSEDSLLTGSYHFGGDDETLYMLDSRGRDKAALVALNFTSGDKTVVAESDKADVSAYQVDERTNEPVAYLVQYLKPEWTALNADFNQILSAIVAKFGSDDFFNILSPNAFLVNLDNPKLVIAVFGPATPPVFYLYDRTTEEFAEFFVARPDLDGSLLQPMQALEVKSRDGLTLTAYLTLPGGSDGDDDGVPEEPLPMVLVVHGGPWSRDSYGYNPNHQLLANRGYAVMSVNYRGSTGFGKAFTNAAVKEFAGKMHDDLIDAVNYAVKNRVADPARVAIMGSSYGGYAALVGLSFTPDVFACGVDMVGMSNLVTLVESVPAYWIAIVAQFHKFIGNPANDTDRADMLARSPITRADEIVAPLLIAQGQNDPRVRKDQSDQMVEEMSQRNQTVTYLNYPDEGHGFRRPENALSFYAVTETFLSQCLGGRSQDYGDDFEGSSVEVLHGAEHVPGLEEHIAEPSPETPELESLSGDENPNNSSSADTDESLDVGDDIPQTSSSGDEGRESTGDGKLEPAAADDSSGAEMAILYWNACFITFVSVSLLCTSFASL